MPIPPDTLSETPRGYGNPLAAACAGSTPFQKGAFGCCELHRFSYSDAVRERIKQKAPLAKEQSAKRTAPPARGYQFGHGPSSRLGQIAPPRAVIKPEFPFLSMGRHG